MKRRSLSIFVFLSLFAYGHNAIEKCINANLSSKINIDKSQNIDARRELMSLIKNIKRI